MKIATKLAAVLFCSSLTGCAAPITYYSKEPNASKPSMVHFFSQGGTYSTIALYEDAKTCKGIQRVAFFEPGVDKTVYIPAGQYLTFSAYVQFPGFPGFKYGSSMYTVPLGTGNFRVGISYNATNMFTKIERQGAGGDWVVVKDAVKRNPHQPLFESGDWCESSSEIQ